MIAVTIFGDFFSFHNLKSKTLKNFGASSGFKGDQLTEDFLFAVRAQEVEKQVHHGLRAGQIAGFGQYVEVEMGGPSGSRRHFPPGISKNPVDEFAGGRFIAGVTHHARRKKAGILEKIENFLPARASGAKEVAFDHAVMFEDKGRFGLDIGVVGREIIGKKLAILKDGINRLAQVTGVTAKLPHGLAVGWLIFAYVKFGWKWHQEKSSGRKGVGKSEIPKTSQTLLVRYPADSVGCGDGATSIAKLGVSGGP